jgi:hypothetical protein
MKNEKHTDKRIQRMSSFLSIMRVRDSVKIIMAGRFFLSRAGHGTGYCTIRCRQM